MHEKLLGGEGCYTNVCWHNILALQRLVVDVRHLLMAFTVLSCCRRDQRSIMNSSSHPSCHPESLQANHASDYCL